MNGSRRFTTIFFVCLILLLAGIGLMTYIIDPFFQYRVKDNQYILNPIYTNPGLAKNYDYNTIIIGSSMAQNFDLSMLRKDSITKPVKLTSGAMTNLELELMYSLSNKEKTNTYIFSIDIVQFNEWRAELKYPSYLYEGRLLDKLQYLYAYESVVRYGLADMILAPYMHYTKEEDRPTKLKYKTNIDKIGDFSYYSIYDNPENIKRLYREGRTVSLPYIYQFSLRTKTNIRNFIEMLEPDKNSEKQYIFILPPYSAVYWHITKKDKYFYSIINCIKYLCRETAHNKNIRIQFYYDINEITDLSRYSDVTHFDPQISNFMLENIYNDEYRITKENMNQKLKDLDARIIQFREENKDWLN